MEYISNTLGNLVEQTAFMNLTFGNLIMIAVSKSRFSTPMMMLSSLEP